MRDGVAPNVDTDAQVAVSCAEALHKGAAGKVIAHQQPYASNVRSNVD